MEYTELSLTKIKLEQKPDQFMKTALETARENDNFRSEWVSIVKNSESSVIQQDFDIVIRSTALPDDYLPGPSWDEILDLVESEGRRGGSDRK